MARKVEIASVEKDLFWVGKALGDLRRFPEDVQSIFGYALYVAQCGAKHPQAKPLQGFSGAGVLEVVERHDGGTFRAVYTVKLSGRVYVLHAFQKKSKKGIKTPKPDMDLIRLRLKEAQQNHKEWLQERKGK